MPTNKPMDQLSLGKATEYPQHYNPQLLQAVPRSLNREQLGLTNQALPFQGVDIWTAYEVSWLNTKGLPQVAIAEVEVPADSPYLIESKSFKLYLNSLNQHAIADKNMLQTLLEKDLSHCAGEPVQVRLYALAEYAAKGVHTPQGHCIDQQDIQIEHFHYNPTVLAIESQQVVTESLYSDLLKSNCLITEQPDWGTLHIEYSGPQINRESLLRYIVGFRNHNEFHEQCVERIYMDMMTHLHPLLLTVQARYTRRGGLDINPLRTNFKKSNTLSRTVRQ
ncbi:NADPH-dependent 7-cyano-7-deazaguanine reductase QueF [Aliidiomarina taiwanensis]|uniref:NADPH-dependent 7-cyano-7-deazaguanine reductase n=1 Tax=Aliidiomarina taiwanensis TaxID=946228 RepID=A0A432XAM3_9GAMM|nr:NADPH-dependent 7-cyano-7-deazaguanine reductase QueF [Aliidiomarina taiwanensis]RUO44370.1 NADPH-dependent 7-cyano-7-deazaguanine reductase QueF [Aliidiomarina taiwanensis]